MYYSPHTKGFYTPAQATPADAIEISDEEYFALLEAQSHGAQIVAGEDGKPVAYREPVDMDALKTQAKRAVDSAAENERLKYVTPGQGQSLTYQRKLEEARLATSQDDPPPEDFPFLAASVGIDGDTVKSVAGVVIEMDRQWSSIGASIEKTRLTAKRDIDRAKDAQSVETVLSSLPWG